MSMILPISEDFEITPSPQFTRDLAHLETKTTQLVFDYGLPHWQLPHITTCFTREKMTMWLVPSQRLHPPVVLSTREQTKARIAGELYVVSVDELMMLDRYKGNEVQSRRKRVPLYVPPRSPWNKPETVEAWVYLSIKSHWLPQIEFDQAIHRNGDAKFKTAEVHVDDRHCIGNFYCMDKDILGKTHVEPTYVNVPYAPAPTSELSKRIKEMKQRADVRWKDGKCYTGWRKLLIGK